MAADEGPAYKQPVSARARFAVAALRDIRSEVTPLAYASVAPSGGRQKLRTLSAIIRALMNHK